MPDQTLPFSATRRACSATPTQKTFTASEAISQNDFFQSAPTLPIKCPPIFHAPKQSHANITLDRSLANPKFISSSCPYRVLVKSISTYTPWPNNISFVDPSFRSVVPPRYDSAGLQQLVNRINHPDQLLPDVYCDQSITDESNRGSKLCSAFSLWSNRPIDRTSAPNQNNPSKE